MRRDASSLALLTSLVLTLVACSSSDEQTADTGAPSPSGGAPGGGGAQASGGTSGAPSGGAAGGAQSAGAAGAATGGKVGAAGKGGAAGEGGGSAGSAGMFATEDETDPYRKVPKSCAYKCPASACAENTTPYACPVLTDWAKLPHAEACGYWDGTLPTPQQGQCTATLATGDAAKYAGPDTDDPTTVVMPDGRRLKPSGFDWVFKESDVYSSMTSAVARAGDTGLVLAVDTGNGDHVVRAIDPKRIDGVTDPVLSYVKFANPETLNQSVVYAAGRVYVPKASGVVQALSLDAKTGKLARDDGKSLTLPKTPVGSGEVDYYASSVAVSVDQTRLFVGGVDDKRIIVFDISDGPTYGKVLGEAILDNDEVFGIYVDPNDPSTKHVYATLADGYAVQEIDVSDPSAPKATRSFAVAKSPQGLAFIDARYMAVGTDLGDTIALIDRTSGAVHEAPVDDAVGLRGLEPSWMTYDAARKVLYATLAGVNAVAAYQVDTATDPPTLTPLGRLPSQWWPSAVTTLDDGSLVVTSLMGRGHGPVSNEDGYSLMHGGIQRIPTPSPAEIGEADKVARAQVAVGDLAGKPSISCPEGVNDFPVPATNTEGPSKQIEHVIVVIRENKTFEGILGDLEGANVKPSGLIAPGKMDVIFPNIRKAAKTFATSDNFHIDAVISNQGHMWTTHGRTVDFNERNWPVTTYSRSTRPVGDSGGVPDISKPVEGSIFDWFTDNGIVYDLLGEVVGLPKKTTPGRNSQDLKYPGGPVQSIDYPDIEKACYVAARKAVLCDLGQVTYMTLPNDHTSGVSANRASPDTMLAVNDEAVGILLAAISRSYGWQKTLVVVTQDDPAGGNDSVDYHRMINVFASPWIKRGYISHTHADISSVYKLIAHIFGIPYPNAIVANAALPLDMFTSTPDYTPFDMVPRATALRCGEEATPAEEALTASWDFDNVDEQPGLEAQVSRWLNGRQLKRLEKGQIERAKMRGRDLDD